jgi:Flp pilus assembly protein TadD
MAGKDRLLAAAFALLLGGFGIHKFYLGRTGQGVVYLLLFWTGIPALIAWVEGILYLLKSDEAWAAEHGGPPQRPSALGLGCLWLIAVLPILSILALIGLIAVGSQVSSILSPLGEAGATPTAIVEPFGTDQPAAGSADTPEVAELKARAAADPSDVDALVQLGDLAYAAEDYETSGDWMSRALAVEPDNVYALIALGACRFNLGDSEGAEEQWQRAVAADPQNQEAWYDLGYLYATQVPPDPERAREAWSTAVEIDPDTELGRTARDALAALGEASPTP